MEVPEQSNTTVNTVANEIVDNISIIEQQNSTEYIMPSVSQRSQQQQQLLLVNIKMLYQYILK